MKNEEESSTRNARKHNFQIPVLTYHSIDQSNSVISASPLTFKKQMNHMKKKGYKTVNPSEVINYIQGKGKFPDKRFVISFDDGFKNNYTEAFPILMECNFTAIIFITTNHCGKLNDWPNQHNSIPSLPMLSWDEIREMSRHGIEFGAHTQNHPRLTDVPITRVCDEVHRSQQEIEEKLSKPVNIFSYPYGSYNERVKEIVMSTFKGAISNRPGKVNSESDIFALERINATSQLFKSLPFEILFLGTFDYYLFFKKVLNKLRNLK